MTFDDLLPLLLIPPLVLLAIWLNAVLRALLALSPARVRRLDPVRQQALIAGAGSWLANRHSYILVSRLLLWLDLVTAAVCAYAAARRHLDLADGLTPALLVGLGVVVVIGFLIEVLGAGWLGAHEWGLLRVSCPLLALAGLLLFPVVGPIAALQRRLGHRETGDDAPEAAAADLMSLVDRPAPDDPASRALAESERRMIRGVFYLEETQVREIMTPRVDIIALPAAATIPEARRQIVATGHSRLPLYKGSIDEIVGVIYSKDLLDDELLRTVGALSDIAHPPMFIPETKRVRDLLEEFKRTQVHIAVIIDEYGGTAGLVTIEDILEEIVGEIRDEYEDQAAPEMAPVGADGSITLEGRTPIAEINDRFALDLPEGDSYDTIGGYVTSTLGRIPKSNEALTVGQLEVLIVAADDRKISRLRLRRRAAAGDKNVRH